MPRLNAQNSGQTRCIVFVNDSVKARQLLTPFVNTIEYAYPFINAFGVSVFVHKFDDLVSLPCVKAVSPNTLVKVNLKKEREVLGVVNFNHELGYGDGVGVCVIDTGVRPHLDFLVPADRINFVDFTSNRLSCYDDNGHGTAVSSIICGNGLVSGCNFCGVAPKANLISLKAIGSNGEANAFKILQAMQWIYDNCDKYNIKVVCMSFGSEPVVSGIDPLSQGAESLWKRGLTVVCSAGNDGPEYGTIKSPGINLNVITVGGAEIMSDGVVKIPDFSSRGSVGNFVKPDVVAPSVDILTCGHKTDYQTHSGTSMSAPIVAGATAVLLSKYPKLTNNRIKELFIQTALPLEFDQNTCGSGLIDLYKIYQNFI